MTPRGIEPLLPPWKGGVLTAWPRGHNWSFMSESNQQPADYKSAALPLSQWSTFKVIMVGEDGFEPSKRNVTDLQSAPFGHSGTPPFKLYIINNLSSFNFVLPNWQTLVYSHYLVFSTPKFYCLSILFFIFYVFLLFTLI